MNSALLTHLLSSGASTASLPSALKEALVAQGATSGTLTEYLTMLGYSGTAADMLATHLKVQGFSGSLSDMLAAASHSGRLLGCAYPLSAGSDEITSLGLQPMTLSADKMTASWVTLNVYDGDVTALAAPSGFSTGASAKLQFTSGTRVIEFKDILMPAGAGGGDVSTAYEAGLYLTSGVAVGGVTVVLRIRKDGTRYAAIHTDADGDGTYATQYTATPATLPSRVTLIVNAAANTLSVLFDGVAVTLTDATMPAGQYVAAISAYQSDSLAAGDVGKTIGATLVTSAASMTGIYYRAGATDPCGNLPVAYTPLSLFANSEVGAWYEPSDFSTMFQDAAGTTPVTAAGQSVGLRLDKSKGLVLGPEKWSDGSVVFSGESSRVSPGVYRIYSSAGALSYAAIAGVVTSGKWYKVTFTIDSITVAGAGVTWVGSNETTFTTTGTKTIYVLASSTSITIKRTSSACDYQISNISVREIAGNHAYQTSLASRATLQLVSGCYGLLYDGTDDFYVTPSIDFTGTDKVTLWAGVRKLSDAAQGIVCELSASSASNNGTFALYAPQAAAANLGWRSKGTAAADVTTSSTITAPATRVMTGIGNIGGDSSILRLNGTAEPAVATDQGTGNYGNYPLYIGRRGGTSLPFNGYDFGIIVRGAQTSDTDIAATERWLAQKTGVTL